MSKLTNWQALPPGTEVFFMQDNRVYSGEIIHVRLELDKDHGAWGNKTLAEIVYTVRATSNPRADYCIGSDIVAETKAELLSRL